MKSVFVVVGVVCVATVLSQCVGATLLWYRGQLSAQTLKEIRLVLSGEAQSSLPAPEEARQEQPSTEDLWRKRTVGILSLESREQELALLKQTITASRDGVLDEQSLFETQKQEFEEKLAELARKDQDEGTEQARGILQALPPADAVQNLMKLTLDEDVVLLQGMPEKTIAKILQEFLQGTDEHRTRGGDIFRAISQGDPGNSLVDETLQKLAEQVPPADAANQ